MMARRTLLLVLGLVVVLGFSSCGGGDDKSFNTDGIKKFVQDSKKNGKMDADKTKKAYKSVFPNMKVD